MAVDPDRLRGASASPPACSCPRGTGVVFRHEVARLSVEKAVGPATKSANPSASTKVLVQTSPDTQGSTTT